MVKQHSQIISFLMGGCDLCVVAGAWVGAFALRFTFFPHDKGIPTARDVLSNLMIVLLVSLGVLAGTGLYKPRRDKSFLLEIGQLLKASVIIWGVLIVMIYFTSAGPFTRGMLVIFLPTLMAGLIFERGVFRSLLRYLRRRGWNLRHALIVGTGRLGQSVMLRLQRNSWTGIRVAGFIEVGGGNAGREEGETGGGGEKELIGADMAKGDSAVATEHAMVRGAPVLGTTSSLKQVIDETGVDCVFVALPSRRGELLRQVIADLERTSVDVRVIPDLFLSRFPTNVGVSELDGMPIVTLRENPLAGWPSVYKRLFDIAGALFGIFLLSPLLVTIALWIKLHDRGPIFYKQRRMSYGRRSFNMLKFRTMKMDAEAAGPAFAMKNDPRCTRLGRWLRSTSLDELPQLLNVLRGDMSLVGPRPERPEMLEKIQQEVPGFPLRLKVRAGLTGWAQIHGYRGRTSFRKRLQYDLYYLNNWSPLLDVRIVFTTLLHLRHPNAY